MKLVHADICSRCEAFHAVSSWVVPTENTAVYIRRHAVTYTSITAKIRRLYSAAQWHLGNASRVVIKMNISFYVLDTFTLLTHCSTTVLCIALRSENMQETRNNDTDNEFRR